MNNKAIICIPGLGASKASFSALRLTKLASQNVIRAVDLIGFEERCGEHVPENPLSLAAQEIADEVDAINGQNVILVGHSLGGAVALLAAKLARTRVFALASLEGNLIAEDCGMSRKLAASTSDSERAAIKDQAIDISVHSSNAGVRDWANGLSDVTVEAIYRHSKQ